MDYCLIGVLHFVVSHHQKLGKTRSRRLAVTIPISQSSSYGSKQEARAINPNTGWPQKTTKISYEFKK
jgi:hypothetical protein